MTTELTGLEDDARVRQAMSDWTNDLLRLRSRPARLGFQRGTRSIFCPVLATASASQRLPGMALANGAQG
ncbi:MAG TPA: hypothetical protein VGM54_04125 [Chthoniobacter sp.]